MDGGLTNNLPKFTDLKTVTVSPFCGDADICTKDVPTMFDWTMTLGSQVMRVDTFFIFSFIFIAHLVVCMFFFYSICRSILRT